MSNFDLNSEAVENTDYILHNSTELEVLNNNKLSKVLEFLPSGIIDKKATGIGATYLELTCNRNSIIVVPTRALAATKAQQHTNTIYVGSTYGEVVGNSVFDIIKKHNKNLADNVFTKIIVVADSLPKVIDAIDDEVYKDFFLMIDEIDSFQMSSVFRPKLETSIDYFLKFDKGCLVSATLKEFSNPKLNEYTKYLIKVKPSVDEIRLTQTSNLIKTTKIYIKQFYDALNNPTETKVKENDVLLVAYNSVSDIVKIVSILDDEVKPHCKILCSPSSRKKCVIDEVDYFSSLEDSKAPAKINFFTSSYFVGIDITDRSHIILIANSNKPHTLLSLETIQQIIGRSRVNTGRIGLVKDQDDNLGVPIPIEELIQTAQRQINAINCVSKHLGKDAYLGTTLDSIRDGIINSSRGGINCSLSRKDINGTYKISWFNLDAFYASEVTKFTLYQNTEVFQKALIANGYKVKRLEDRKDNFTASENEILNIVDEQIIENSIALKKETIDKLESENGEIDNFSLVGVQNDVVNYFERLNKHISQNDSIKFLRENYAEKKDARIINTICMACEIYFLDANHNIKKQLNYEFEIDNSYTKEEVQIKIDRIFSKSLDAGVNMNFTSPKQRATLFKAIYETKRSSKTINGIKVNTEKIISNNRYNFKSKPLYDDLPPDLKYEVEQIIFDITEKMVKAPTKD